jgi:hypothetical protein
MLPGMRFGGARSTRHPHASQAYTNQPKIISSMCEKRWQLPCRLLFRNWCPCRSSASYYGETFLASKVTLCRQTRMSEAANQNMMQCLPRTTNFNSYSIEFKFVFDSEVLVVERNPNRMSLDHMSPAGHWQISAYRYHLRPYLPQIQFQCFLQAATHFAEARPDGLPSHSWGSSSRVTRDVSPTPYEI